MSKQFFGTDGIRDRVNQGFMTAEKVIQLGYALGYYLKQHSTSPKVIVGQDTRASGDLFKMALGAGLMSYGVDFIDLGVVPTPVVAFMTVYREADCGVVISASHNPYHDNGIKLFDHQGIKVSDDFEMAIEALLKTVEAPMTDHIGQLLVAHDDSGPYIEYCLKQFASLSGNQKIVLDCAHGATYQLAPAIFQRFGYDVQTIGGSPNGVNINQGCGATDLTALQQAVVGQKADLGFAFDGDGDRLIAVDKTGAIIDGDLILYIIARYLGQQTGVVGTVMTNLAIEQALKQQGIDLIRAKVGDKYVFSELQTAQWQLGAESSGHLIHLGYHQTGDGIITALLLLMALDISGKRLDQAVDIQKAPQVMHNVVLSERLSEHEASNLFADLIEQSNSVLADQGRVVLRPSGTEPLLRVMVEANDIDMAKQQADWLAQQVEDRISQSI